ncbi:formin-binding protein 4-like isoform X2 [Alosa sapidissima]|uniref:formin-binding protein 4-like isoform X2 n=1 Tax=Alosa sapidissima TaxID=34773 RepID=UPI001C088FBC|nr:formin-binding protein 4-like isoform X2 [Alosa sapidissima]
MAKLHNPTVRLLLTVLLLRQGTRGDFITVSSSVRETATLPCKSVLTHYPDCSATTWTYDRSGKTFEAVTLGRIRSENIYRAERLTLLPDCSLHITDVTTEDIGLYRCWQSTNGAYGHEPLTLVYLSVLTIYASEAGNDVFLDCILETHDNCHRILSVGNVHLSWVDEGGAELQNTNSLQISRASFCETRLTEKLRAPNPTSTQRTRRCHVTAGGQVQTSVSYTLREPDGPAAPQPATPSPTTPPPPQPDPTAPETPPQPPSTPPKTAPTPTPTPGSASDPVLYTSLCTGLLAVVAVCAAAFLVSRKRGRACGKRDGQLTQTDTSQTGNLTYAEVAQRSQAHALPPNAADSVTYATINITHQA